MTDIVERISQLPELANLPGGTLAADCLEAAVEIKQLRAENEKLRAALKRDYGGVMDKLEEQQLEIEKLREALGPLVCMLDGYTEDELEIYENAVVEMNDLRVAKSALGEIDD